MEATPTLTDEQAAPYILRAKAVFDAYLDGFKPSNLTDLEKFIWTNGMTALIRENLDAQTLPFFVELVVLNQTSVKASDRARASHKEDEEIKKCVFSWLDSQINSFASAEAAGKAICKQQPIAHKTAVKYYKAWKKYTSAGRG